MGCLADLLLSWWSERLDSCPNKSTVEEGLIYVTYLEIGKTQSQKVSGIRWLTDSEIMSVLIRHYHKMPQKGKDPQKGSRSDVSQGKTGP